MGSTIAFTCSKSSQFLESTQDSSNEKEDTPKWTCEPTEGLRFLFKNQQVGTSLVAQLIRILLSMHETW